MTFVYVVIHRVTNTWYVGYTRQPLKARWKRHRSDAKRRSDFRFHRALRSHGFQAFDWILYGEYPSMYEGQEAEGALISFCRIRGIEVYNCTDGGQGTAGWVHSPEVRAQLSTKLTGTNNPSYGKTLSELQRRELSALMKSRAARGVDHYMYGRTHSNDTLAKMSETSRTTNAFRGRTHSEESRMKMREAALQREKRKRELSL